MNCSRAFLAILATTLITTTLHAAPILTGVDGAVGNRQSVRISGIGFGSKNPVAPLVWADFDNGLSPGAGSVHRAWDQIENMTWSAGEGANGTGCAKAADGEGFWTLRVDHNAWTNDGQRMYIFKKEKLNFRVTSSDQNWKSWRMWPAGNGYPNIYASTSHGRVFVEEIGGDGGYWADMAVSHTDWSTQEIIFQASSMNQKNGRLDIRYDGRTIADGAIMTRSSESPALMQWNYVVHGVGANQSSWSPSWSNGNRIWADDVYVDTTWSRVMLGDAPTFAACHKLEIQIPTAWSDNSISILARTAGTFAQGSNAYLYVFDSNGSVNAVGMLIRVGVPGAGSPPDPVVPRGPVASAGPDSVASVGTQISLRGSYTTGTAAGTSSRWSAISGPGRVEFTNPNDQNTMATFSDVGDYILRFSVQIGDDQSYDQVRITVIPSSLGEGAVKQKNFFNPNRGETFRIVHVMDQPGRLQAKIMDRTGHLVRSIDGGDRPAGEQVVEWDGRNLDGNTVASGVYFVIREANGKHVSGKVAVIK